MVTKLHSTCTADTTAAMPTEMADSQNCSAAQGRKLSSAHGGGGALFVWKRFIDDSGQQGVYCAVFRNESPHRSSELIRQADAIADYCWPGMRHYTYVNAEKIRSVNPGYCFVCAGWQRCGYTKGGLIVLERLAAQPEEAGE